MREFAISTYDLLYLTNLYKILLFFLIIFINLNRLWNTIAKIAKINKTVNNIFNFSIFKYLF